MFNFKIGFFYWIYTANIWRTCVLNLFIAPGHNCPPFGGGQLGPKQFPRGPTVRGPTARGQTFRPKKWTGVRGATIRGPTVRGPTVRGPIRLSTLLCYISLLSGL